MLKMSRCEQHLSLLIGVVAMLLSLVQSFVKPYPRRHGLLARNNCYLSMGLETYPGKFDSRLMEGFLSRIRENNDMKKRTVADFQPFVVDKQICGYINPEFAANLMKYGKQTLQAGNGPLSRYIYLRDDFTDFQSRSNAVAEVLGRMRADGLITGWRDELVAVSSSFDQPPLLLVERAAYEWFGTKGYGVHINGYIQKDHTCSPEKLWVGKRAVDKSTWPNMLDHISAGGQPYGISVMENVLKECGEEAGIPEHMARSARPVGYVSYCQVDDMGRLKRDTLFCFDIALPVDFQPSAVDGEVQGFECLDINGDIMKLVAQGGAAGYKPNCNLVVLDFLVRHGFIPPDASDYLKLVGGLRQNVDFDTSIPY